MINKYSNLFFSVLLSLSLFFSVYLITDTYKKKTFSKERGIWVKGSSSKDFESNLIVWNGTFSRKGKELKEIYESLKKDQDLIEDYLLKKEIKKEELIFSSVTIIKDFKNNYNQEGKFISEEFLGYNLSQQIKIESEKIDQIEKIARNITELIQLGIELYSELPYYYYTNLSSLKHKMLEEASKDARIRAEKIVQNAKGQLGNLINANMGTFQIVGKNSNEEYSYGGSFNTKDRFKTANVTVNLRYTIK